MATFQHGEHLRRQPDPVFDDWHRPGDTVPASGIYRCMGCGREVAANKGTPLPPQDHHQHRPTTLLGGERPIKWRLLVRTEG